MGKDESPVIPLVIVSGAIGVMKFKHFDSMLKIRKNEDETWTFNRRHELYSPIE